jgi:hypothetical protein
MGLRFPVYQGKYRGKFAAKPDLALEFAASSSESRD